MSDVQVCRGEIRTTTSFASADVTRLSSQYSQPPRDAINAVSVEKTRFSQTSRLSFEDSSQCPVLNDPKWFVTPYKS